jgi:hypothetical protein
MKSQSIYKVPNGKLLKISLDYDETSNVIRQIRITGDFFAYPEEAIVLIEKKLRNTALTPESLQEKISFIIHKHHVEFIGLNAQGLTKGILMSKL